MMFFKSTLFLQMMGFLPMYFLGDSSNQISSTTNSNANNALNSTQGLSINFGGSGSMGAIGGGATQSASAAQRTSNSQEQSQSLGASVGVGVGGGSGSAGGVSTPSAGGGLGDLQKFLTPTNLAIAIGAYLLLKKKG